MEHIDHEIKIRSTMHPHGKSFDISWARDHIKGFAKHEANVHAKVTDEKRYKNQPGYVPNHEPDIRAAARRGYNQYLSIIAFQRPRAFIEAPEWERLGEVAKRQWEEIAKAVLA